MWFRSIQFHFTCQGQAWFSACVHVRPCTWQPADHRVCASELKEAAEASQAQQRSDKQRRKQAELRLSSLEEELQDLKAEKDSLDRVRGFHL